MHCKYAKYAEALLMNGTGFQAQITRQLGSAILSMKYV